MRQASGVMQQQRLGHRAELAQGARELDLLATAGGVSSPILRTLHLRIGQEFALTGYQVVE